jgi:SAM-dependent methyltransferase
VVGSDPDPLALARAQRKARGITGIRFERAYAQELPFADGEFDRVLSSMMLHHLAEDVKALRRSGDLPRFTSRRHIAHRRHRWAHNRPPWFGGAVDEGPSACCRQPRRRDTASAPVGRVRLRRGRHASEPPYRTAHVLSRHPPGLATERPCCSSRRR